MPMMAGHWKLSIKQISDVNLFLGLVALLDAPVDTLQARIRTRGRAAEDENDTGSGVDSQYLGVLDDAHAARLEHVLVRLGDRRDAPPARPARGAHVLHERVLVAPGLVGRVDGAPLLHEPQRRVALDLELLRS